MRKLFTALLILSVMGGAFAQEWSFSGSADIGTVIDFEEDPVKGEGAGYDGLFGKVSAGYDNGGLSIGIDYKFNVSNGSSDISASAAYEGDNFFVKIGGSLSNLISAPFYNKLAYDEELAIWIAADPDNNNEDNFDFEFPFPPVIDDLWGYYKFLDQKIHLEVAYNGQDAGHYFTGFYAQDKADIWGDANLNGISGIWVDFGLIEGLNFGFVNRGLFNINKYDFIDVFKATSFGLTFSMVENLEISALYSIEGSNILLTGKYGLGDMAFGFLFNANFNSGFIGDAAVNFDFNAGAFGVSLGAALMGIGDTLNTFIYPKVTYNIIPESLAVMVEGGLKFGSDLVGFMVCPSLWFNFKGTGAVTGYDDFDTGIIVRYKFANDKWTGEAKGTNAFDITFRWAF